MQKREDVIREAREWVGTPFHHQAASKGVGCDCAGLVRGVGQALGLMPPLPPELLRYGRLPQPERMREVLARFMDPVEGPPLPGDVLFMGWVGGRPMHLGILTPLHGRGILHGFSEAGRVIETRLPVAYEARIDSWWKYRGLE